MLTQYIKVCSPVGCDPFIETTTWKVYFTSAEARLRLHRTREEDPEVVFLRREKKKGFIYTSYIVYFKSRDIYSLLVKINDMEVVRDSMGDPQPLFDMEANFFELAIKLSVLGDLREPTTLTFTVPDQWSITREETWTFTRKINNDLCGQAYGTAIQYSTTTMETYKWIYVLFKMYSDTL